MRDEEIKEMKICKNKLLDENCVNKNGQNGEKQNNMNR